MTLAEPLGDYLNWEPVEPRSRAGRVLRGAALGSAVLIAATCATLASRGSGPGRVPVATVDLPEASDFMLASAVPGGAVVRLSALAGRPVVLGFFASWSSDSGQELRQLVQLAGRAPKDVAVVGIDVDDDGAGAVDEMLGAAHASFPVGADGRATVASMYSLDGVPATVFITASHRVAGTVDGALSAPAASSWMADLGG